MTAILIALLLSFTTPGTRQELGVVVNHETIQTDNNLWYYDTDVEVGSFIIVTFDTLGTESIYDDPIIRVAKIG